ncbi:hypothetical protein [Nonomuraea sp. NPDC050643]|uniref:hypothetical protein n=1 Tax=Nonomuraea sp. NPDC050643 TaxID=3155660 RepID=UPI0033D47509
MRHLSPALLAPLAAALVAVPLAVSPAAAASHDVSVTLRQCVEAGGRLGMDTASPTEYVCVGGSFDGRWIAIAGPVR